MHDENVKMFFKTNKNKISLYWRELFEKMLSCDILYGIKFRNFHDYVNITGNKYDNWYVYL